MKTEKTKAIKIELKDAEKTRLYLKEKNILKNNLKIKKDENYIYLPIRNNINKNKDCNYNIIITNFEKQNKKINSYKELLLRNNKITSKEILNKLPTSYDIIGKIILIKLQDELIKYQKEIGESLLKVNNNVKTICTIEPVKGELRTRNIKIISGEKNTKTIHKENGIKYNIDLRKIYFSPRLATERMRITNLVKPEEVIVDMFTGLAPFSINIAKYANPRKIYAIDKNKYAIEYAKKNIRINNVLDKIEVIHSDAKKVNDILNKKNEKANRIIMNLPFSAKSFLPYAFKISKEKIIIHYYDIIKEEDINNRIKELKKIAKVNNYKIINFNIIKIKTYSPREFYICIDITAKKNIMPT